VRLRNWNDRGLTFPLASSFSFAAARLVSDGIQISRSEDKYSMVTRGLIRQAPKPCVIARLHGGLGNQLFIYATARALSLRSGVPLKLDVGNFSLDRVFRRRFLLDRFCIQAVVLPPIVTYTGQLGRRLRSRWLRFSEARKPFQQRKYLAENGPGFDDRLLGLRVRNRVCLDGYWQSYRYFEDHAASIASELTIKRLPDDDLNLATRIQSTNAVSIHVRQTQITSLMDASYYKTAIQWVQGRVRDPVFYVFSDDAPKARTLLPEGLTACFIDRDPDKDKSVEELCLLRLCHHHIIANSTYSWWGAWLGAAHDKLVVAPKPCLHWGHDGLIPPAWITL